jgi:aminoglycoside phosphotransferase family enzyme/predicted kinase
MIEDQTSIIAFLKRELGEPAWPPEIIETHISLVFLTQDRAFKLKRAVKLAYVDFSTPALRLDACLKEVALNARTAPDLYLGVRRITRKADGQLAFDGRGETFDAVVEMARFDQDRIFDEMALAGKLTPALMTELAYAIAQFHQSAPPIYPGSGAAIIAGVLDINENAFAACHLFPRAEVERLNRAFREVLARHTPLLDRRGLAGKIRRCHGDLHLRNIYLAGEKPQLFDCVEFNEAIATIDVAYDLAFLLIDLWHRGLHALANLVMNRYFDASGEDDAFVLLPFLMALRAAIRAHVTATQIEESESACPEMAIAGNDYFALAQALLHGHPSPHLFAIGGLSGSGKSTLAEALAPAIAPPPGARILESDRIRKAMHGVRPEARLGSDAYRPELSTKVYQMLSARAALILAAGGAVVVDAVFDNPAHRALIEESARAAGVPFTGVWLEAAPSVLRQRVERRNGGVSDATVDVLEAQLRRGAGDNGWIRVDAGRPAGEIAHALVARRLSPGQ